jgi:ubiquinone/menaquinone biosynthesis C-methylase UbiE
MNLNNSEEYDNPVLYDKENEAFSPELPFLIEWAAKQEGPIIDIACGTGRITIPLAQSGHKLIGVDVHKGMLDEARKKSAKENLQINWVEQDCTKLMLDIKTKLAFSVGNSFQHFLTNESIDGLLSSVHNHLEMGGIFIFGTRFPSTEELLQPPTEEYWRTYTDYETKHTVDVYTISTYDALNQIQHYETIRKYKNTAREVVNEIRTTISLRYVFPKEMERILSDNGFEMMHLYCDWEKNPITNDSYEMIYVCKKI